LFSLFSLVFAEGISAEAEQGSQSSISSSSSQGFNASGLSRFSAHSSISFSSGFKHSDKLSSSQGPTSSSQSPAVSLLDISVFAQSLIFAASISVCIAFD